MNMSVDQGIPVESSLNTICHSNSEGFARILKLYTRPGQTIIDPTYGNGTFWSGIDTSQYNLIASDIKTGIDLRNLPYDKDSVDMVVCDIPYRYTPEKNKKHEDTDGHGKVDALYNLQNSKLTNTQKVLELYYEGMQEAKRVLKSGGFLIVKCQDTVQDGKNIWVHNILMSKAGEMGFACRDILIVVTKSPTKSRWNMQRHFRKAHSYFLVLRKDGHFPFGIPSMCER